MTRPVSGNLKLRPGPFAPMGRPYIDPLVRFGVGPATENATARERQSMGAVVIDDRQFKITVEWRAGYGLPFHTGIM